MSDIILSIRVNDKPVKLKRRISLAYAFIRLAFHQLIGTRYQLDIHECLPIIDDKESK